MSDLETLRLRRHAAALLAPWAGGATPGAAIGVVRDGALLLHEQAGLASLELGVPIGPDTCFRIASVSKQFTCAAVLLLAQDGRLDPQDDLRDHLPEFPDLGVRITLAHLMHNSSGIRDMLEIMRQGGADLGQPCTPDDLLDGILRQRGLNFPPGSRFLYSNSNFLLLGLVVERLSGEALPDFLQRRIFAPLGMSRTRMTPDLRVPVPGLATGYLPRDGGFMRAPHAFPLGGEGGLVSCVEDLALWERDFAAGRVGGAALSAALQQQAPFLNGVPNLYARGLATGLHRGVRTVSHGGLWPGYKTEFLRAPELDAAVIVVSNHGGSDPGQLAHAMLDALVEGRPGVHPVPSLPPPASLEALAGRWVDREAGATLDIALAPDGAPVVTVGGVPVRPLPAADGRLAATRGTILMRLHPTGPDAVEIEADAGHLATWHRVAPGAALPTGLAGTYESAEMAATWRFAAGPDGARRVRVDGPLLRGAAWSVEPVEGDLIRIWLPAVLYRSWLDVRVRRGADGAVAGLLVSSNRLKDVPYARVG